MSLKVENPEITNAVHQRLTNVDDTFDSEQILASLELQEYTTQFIVFKDVLCDDSNLAKFWKSFLDHDRGSPEPSLFNKSRRMGFVCRSSKKQPSVSFFAYDRSNYSR